MTDHATPEAHSQHGAHHVNYWAIGGILAILTAISWIADEVANYGDAHGGAGQHASASPVTGEHGTDAHGTTAHPAPAKPAGGFSIKSVVIFIVMLVAVAKASFVIAYFMHVKYEGRWIYAMLLPTIILACAIPAALMPDIGIHYYLMQTFQTDERDAQLTEEEHEQPAPAHP